MLRIARDIPTNIEQHFNEETGRAEYSAFADNIWLGDCPTEAEAKRRIKDQIYDWLNHGLIGDRPAGYRRIYAVGRRHYQRRRAA